MTREELRDLLSPHFSIGGIWGIHNQLPKGAAERMGEAGYWLDRGLERLPISHLFAVYLLSSCHKMAAWP